MANVPLKAELTNDPLARGYSGMTDQQATDSLMLTLDRQPPGNPTFPSSEVLQRIDQAEFLALNTGNKRRVWDVLHLTDVNPWGLEAGLLTNVFGGGSLTITALSIWRDSKRVSRAVELGLGRILVGHVHEARL